MSWPIGPKGVRPGVEVPVGEVLLGTGLDPAEVEMYADAIEALQGEAQEAREDLVKFFDFVMRKEHGQREAGAESAEGMSSLAKEGEPIRAAAHQRVIFRFIQENPMCVIRMPPDTSKTYCMATAGLWAPSAGTSRTAGRLSRRRRGRRRSRWG